MSEAREVGAAFVLLTMSYWLFVGEISADEAGLAVAAGVLIALWAATVSHSAEIGFRLEWKACLALLSALAEVPRAAARMTVVLVSAGTRRPRGGFAVQPFDHGPEGNPAAATRRAIALLAVSLAPDRFAVLNDGDRLRLHRVGTSPQTGDEQWPG